MADVENYEVIIAAEAAFLSAVEDEEIKALYLAARGGDADAYRILGGIAIANLSSKLSRSPRLMCARSSRSA